MLRGREHQAEGPLLAWGRRRLPVQGGWRSGAAGEGKSSLPLAFLQAPGCRPSCYSSGLEPSSGTAAARTARAARRSVGAGRGGDVRDPSPSLAGSMGGRTDTQVPGQARPLHVDISDTDGKHRALPFRGHGRDRNTIPEGERQSNTPRVAPSVKALSHYLVGLTDWVRSWIFVPIATRVRQRWKGGESPQTAKADAEKPMLSDSEGPRPHGHTGRSPGLCREF